MKDKTRKLILDDLKDNVLTIEKRNEFLAYDLRDTYIKTRSLHLYISCPRGLSKRWLVKDSVKPTDMICGTCHINDKFYKPPLYMIEYLYPPMQAQYCLEEVKVIDAIKENKEALKKLQK